MKKFPVLFILLLLLATIAACKKQSVITDKNAMLILPSDTLTFDTVFTSTGSVSQYFTIVNPNNGSIKLNTVKLMGGLSSPYKINVDGISSTQVNNIEIAAEDSMYIFISVTIDPSTADLPFIVQDSILINYNGNEKYIQLQAYGQNAHFLKNYLIESNTNWKNDLPYVISGGVLIDKDATLTIEKGCRIYMHANAPFVVDGTLKVNGTKRDSIIFQGDRLDKPYRDLPGSWPGIYFRETSKENIIAYGIIKNAYQGIIALASAGTDPVIQLNECVIDNIYDIGILASATSISAVNCLISNCGSNIVLKAGGNYEFTYCTIASYGNAYVEHKKPVLSVSNTDDDSNYYDLNAVFRNCILWGDEGNVDNEVTSDKKGTAAFQFLLDHTLYKAKSIPADITLNNCIGNIDPAFDSVNANRRYFDFHIGNKQSPAIGSGVPLSINNDLDGKTRTGDADLGCYTKH